MSIKNIQELNVGLNGSVGFKPIIIKQFDKNTRRIEITLLEGSDIYEIPTGSVAKFQATKPNREIIFDDCTIENGLIVYKATEQLSTCVGTVKCEVGLYNPVGDELLQSSTFDIVVEKSAMDRNAVASSSEFNTLTIMINTITGLVERAENTIEEINTAISNTETAIANTEIAVNNAEQATSEAQQATVTINETNQTIINSENIRIESENVRKSDEIIRQSHETTRQTNTTAAITRADTATTRANLAAKSCEDIASGIIQLPDIGVANTYTKVTTDTKGRVTSGSTPTAIADLGITNVYTKAEIDTKTNDINTSLANQIGTASGASINLNNTYNGGLFFKELQGKSVQNGTPTPDAKADIVSVGDDGSVAVIVTGKNLFNFSKWVGIPASKATVVWDTISSSMTITATADDGYTEYSWGSEKAVRIPVKPNATYTLSWDYVGAIGNVLVFYNGVSAENISAGNNYKKLVFTTKADTTFVTFRVGVSKSGTSCTYSKLQFEEGENKTTYELYKAEQLVTIPLTQSLRSVGSVHDRGCVKNGGLWGNERKFVKIIFTGTETWSTSGNGVSTLYNLINIVRPTSLSEIASVSCNYFSPNSWNSCMNSSQEGVCLITSPNKHIGFYSATYGTDITKWKQFLTERNASGNPLYILVELATSTFEPYSQSLQDILNKLQSYTGVTNVFTTDPQQPIISVSYGKTDTAALTLYANNIHDSKVDKARVTKSLAVTESGFIADAEAVKTINDKADANTKAIGEVNNNLYIKQLVNKKIAFLGDSICFGYGWRPSSTDTTTPTGWGKVIQDNNASATVSNKGASGARICKNTTNDSLVNQIDTLVANKTTSNYDYIILEGGINDQFAQSLLGSYIESYSITYNESTVSTVYGALDYIFYKLQMEFEDSRIGYIISNRDASYTSKSGYRKYIDAIIKMCQKWSVPVLNLWDCGEMNPVLVNIKNKYVPDGTHPNELCYKKLLAPKIASWIKSDLITNPILTMNDIFRSWEWCSDCNNEFHFGYKTITPESANCPMSGYGLLIVETAGDSESWIYHTIKYNTGQIYRRVKVNQGDYSTWA